MSKILIKRSQVPGKVPTIQDLEFGQLATNYHDGKLFTKIEYATDVTVEQRIIDFSSSVENVLFVSKNGNDYLEGTSWNVSLASVEKALELAAERGTLTLIEIGPGRYTTRGHIDMPDNTMIRCAHRTVIFEPEPGFEERNVFRMGSGCFIEGPLFEGFRVDNIENPSEGFAISFRPGAVITRTPYVHKIAIRSIPSWSFVAPPLDRANANPLVATGGGVVLADGAVCSPYSIFPNIMTWGATPVAHNGVGYCAKNGGLINAVNAVSLWAHKHFYALNGGQIILSSCSTQFGDYTLVAKGTRNLLAPEEVSIPLTVQSSSASVIDLSRTILIDNVWNYLETNNFTIGWDQTDEDFTRRDTATLLQSISWVLLSANEKPMLDFARGLFNMDGSSVFTLDKRAAFIASFVFIKTTLRQLAGVTTPAADLIDSLIDSLINTITTPSFRIEPSVITAIGHTFTAVFAGVALTKVPPARNSASIQDSILELDNGLVIASGQDDQGNAIFVGGLQINADTGELGGPPFEQAVNRIATRTAISRSF